MLSVIMLNVTYKPFVLSVIMQSAVRLSVVAPFVNASYLYFVRKPRTPLGLAPNFLANINLG